MEKIRNKVYPEIIKLLELIKDKTIYFIKLEYYLQQKYSNIKQKNIFIFDIEFIDQKFKKTIFEFGGIIISRYKHEWYLISTFHVNLKPFSKISDQSLLTHYYSSVSSKNLNKVIQLEKILLPHYYFEKHFDGFLKLSYIEKKNLLNSNKELLLNEQNKENFIKILKKCIFKINGQNLLNYKLTNEYDIFKKINTIIQIDGKKRNVDNVKLFLNLLNKIFDYSFLIVKGGEDFKALVNHSFHYNIIFTKKKYYDISIYNDYLYNNYKTAELKKAFDFLMDDNKIGLNLKYYILMKKYIEYKAHNPLYDSLLTWLTFNIFMKI